MGTSPGVGEGAPGWGGGTRGARRVPVMSGAVLSTPSQAGVGWGCHLLVGRRAQARDPEGGSKVCRVAKEQRLQQPACCWEKGLRETCWGECGSFGERATLRQSQELGVHEDAPLH